jgi:CheY-like chemotaxis protein
VRILVADADETRAKRLCEALVARGFAVDAATSGPVALELALERSPRVVVAASDLPLIDGGRLAGILRANPRTRGIAMLFLVEDELDAPVAMELRDRIAASPWRDEDVVTQVEATVGRDLAPPPGPTGEIEGELSRIPLADLVHLLLRNRRSGAVRVSSDAQTGAIQVREGEIVDASARAPGAPPAGGEKALFRLLALSDGRFSFAPDTTAVVPGVHRTTRVLLAEAARQLDEWERRRAELPGLEARVRPRPLQAADSEAQDAEHPLARAVMDAAASERRVEAIVDACPFPDYQVLRAIGDLLARGRLELEPTSTVADERSRPADEAIFTPLQTRRLREWMAAQRPRPGTSAKVLVVPGDATSAAVFAAALGECRDFTPAQAPGEPPPALGELGQFPLGEGRTLRLVLTPPTPEYQPLWSLAAYGLLGAFVMLREPLESALAATQELVSALRASGRPLLHVVTPAAADGPIDDAARRLVQVERGGPLFVLPAEPDPLRRAILQNLFARLLP